MSEGAAPSSKEPCAATQGAIRAFLARKHRCRPDQVSEANVTEFVRHSPLHPPLRAALDAYSATLKP